MFMGSFPFGGMLGSCRREGMCMLTLISEKGKLIMLIKTSSRIRKQKCNTQTLSKTSVSICEEHIKGETSLNKPIC